MTIEQLEQYYGLSSYIDAIEAEISQLYNTVHSPIGNGAHSTEPGNPTERTALRIIKLRDQLEAEKERLISMQQEIDDWLETVEDAEIAGIIKWHYIMRCNWKVTNRKVYGYPDYYYSRKRVIRYFEKLSKLSKEEDV